MVSEVSGTVAGSLGAWHADCFPTASTTVRKGLADHDYLADDGLATSIFLALRLQRPAAARRRGGRRQDRGRQGARALDRRRARAPPVLRGHRRDRRPCTSGTTRASSCTCARSRRAAPRSTRTSSTPSGSSCKRPLLRALAHEGDVPPVLLIDEVDRADDEFEAFLLEILSDWSISVPELGVVRATVPPVVVLTSNRTRDVHDALKRRCLYHWIAHPDFERELAIVRLRAPEVPERLAREVAGRGRGAARARALQAAGCRRDDRLGRSRSRRSARARLDEQSVDATLGTILKYREDQERVRAHGLGDLVRAAAAARADVGADGLVADRPETDRVAVAFARVLRGAGVDVPVGATLDFAQRPRPRRPRRPRAASTGPAGRRSCAAPTTRRVRPRVRRVLGSAARPRTQVDAGRSEVPIALDVPTSTMPDRRRRGRGHARARRWRCGGARSRCCATATSRRTRRPSSSRPAA